MTDGKKLRPRDSHAFKFRTLTLRQLRDGRFFFHNGSLTRVKDVVKYFNAGVPQDREAAAASTFAPRFPFPRGPSSPRGLGRTISFIEATSANQSATVLVRRSPASA